MPVPVPLRGYNQLWTINTIVDMVTYTMKITSNKKVFLPEFDVVTERIVNTALSIFDCAWGANNIRVSKNPYRWLKRRDLQETAIIQCDNLQGQITLAKRVFHLKTKRMNFWNDSIEKCHGMLMRWRVGDCKRYDYLVKIDGKPLDMKRWLSDIAVSRP